MTLRKKNLVTLFENLDVGCGVNPQGDVNVDYCTGWNPEATSEGAFVEPQSIRNFVKADGQFLPFRDKTFIEVTCTYMIEHVNNPYRLLDELIRVCNGTVFLKCPHRFNRGAKLRIHRHFLTVRWFKKVLKGFSYEASTIYRHPIPFCGLVRLPNTIEIKIFVSR